MNGKVALVLSYQYPGKYAFTVLAGAVESDPALADVPIHFLRDRDSLLATLRQCVDEGYTVVAAWSFYSASFGPAVEELAWVRERLEGRGARVHGHTFMPLPGTPYRDAPPGRVDEETQRRLGVLASQGRLYGHWKQQVSLAEQIAERRQPRARGGA